MYKESFNMIGHHGNINFKYNITSGLPIQIFKKSLTIPHIGKDCSNWNFYTWLMDFNMFTILENYFAILPNPSQSYDLALPLLGTYPREMST